MTFWAILAALTVIAIAAVLVPLLRARVSVASKSEHDVAVYKDQLGEIDRDVELGTLNPQEAEAARSEVARRLLRASREADEGSPRGSSGGRRLAVIGLALIGVPVLAGGLYWSLGSPQMPDQPLAGRLQNVHGGNDIAALVKRMENFLAENPDDGRGWAIVAPIYLRIGATEKAITAFTNALRLNGPNADLEAGLGESHVAQEDGTVTPEARAAFERAVKLDPKAVRPRFFLAVALNQQGKHAESVAAWDALLKDADPEAPWVPFAQRQLASARQAAGMAPVTPATPPAQAAAKSTDGARGPTPSAEDVARVQAMAPEDRQAMIQNMVSGLAERLESDGGTVDEWLRLLNAYGVLGKKDEAVAALAKARAAYADDAAALERLAAIGKRLGLPE
ncbi:MAG: c-type cytochrome biogenesis protein CcmI [Hyphomicrobiales bacterium]|nr:MAG: c-type cytochrome biogenesis protein CcmI [Hyphomicrobiales bacterium]